MKRRSKSFRRDPSLMRGRIKRFEKRLVSLFEDARPELEALVDKVAKGREMEGLNLNSVLLLAQLNSILTNRILTPGNALVTDNAVDAYLAGMVRADQLMGIKASASLRMPTDKRVIEALKLKASATFQGLTDEMSKTIMQTITDGIMRGDGSDAIARAISERVDVSKSRARTIARTESMSGFNAGAKARYKQQGVSKVEWSYAGEDGRTCDYCRSMDGKQYDADDAPNLPTDSHPNCRCVMLPVITPLEDL